MDGRGVTQSQLGFETPVPDFSDCSFSTVEPDADWMAVSHDGGPARAFDRRMPAFGDAMTDAERQRVLDHIRRFCGNPAWPRGELNVPRALVTEKAFPENEAVLTTTVGARGSGRVGNEFLYERRIGARTQYEVVVPLLLQEAPGGGWDRGLGDVAVAVKHVLLHSLDRGNILSVAGEVVLPTGKESAGLGSGVTVFEPFVAFGQLLPADGFFQFQAGLELPADTARAGREAFWRTALGKSFTEGRFGRSWSPMVATAACWTVGDEESPANGANEIPAGRRGGLAAGGVPHAARCRDAAGLRPAGTGVGRAPGHAVPDVPRLPRLPQRPDHPGGRGRVDRRVVARVDDGELLAGSPGRLAFRPCWARSAWRSAATPSSAATSSCCAC